ncbi:hypothetical protein K8T06_01755 [bacterium]|nr:hypothetical protein [bacterium]
MTFGWQVEEKHTYPSQLQNRLDRFSYRTFAVFNAGIPGHTSFQGKHRLPRLLEQIKPTIVVLSFSINDRFPATQTDEYRYNHFRGVKNMLSFSPVYRFLSLQLSSHQPRHFNPMLPIISESVDGCRRVMPNKFQKNLLEMIRLCKSVNSKVILMNEYVNNLTEPYDEYHVAALVVAKEETLPIIDSIAILMPRDIHRLVIKKQDKILKKKTTTPSVEQFREDPISQQKIKLLAFEKYDPNDGVMVDPYHPINLGYNLIADALADEISSSLHSHQ